MLGEATSGTIAERYDDMRAIASTIVNRAVALNVSPDSVVSAPGQFSAYGKSLPKGTAAYRALAEKAFADVVANGPIHNGTFYATHKRVGALPKGLTKVATTKAHTFFDDPQNRAIETSLGTTKVNVAQKQLAQAWAAQNIAAAQMQTQTTNKRTPTRGTTVSDLGATVPSGLTSPLGVMGDRITSNFGPRTAPKTATGYGSEDHKGTDLSLGPTAGYAAEAIAGGQVKHAGPLGKLGNAVTISHPDGTTSTYGHLASISVAMGDNIARGTPIGTVGEAGNAKGPHLHLSMRDKFGNVVDPASMIDFNRTTRVPTPTARPTTTPQATPETAVSAFSTVRDAISPALAAISAQMNPATSTATQSFATQRAVQRDAQAAAASAQQQQANRDRAQQMAEYGAGQQAMRNAMAAQQQSQVSAKTSRIGADARAALAAGLNDQRAGLTSQTPIGIAGRTIGAMAGNLSKPTSTSSTIGELAGSPLSGRFANNRSTTRDAAAAALNAQRDSFAEARATSLDGALADRRTAINALGDIGVSDDAKFAGSQHPLGTTTQAQAMRQTQTPGSLTSFASTLGDYAKNTSFGQLAQGLALAADVTTPDVAAQLAAGVTPQDAFGTTLAPISFSDDFTSPVATSYAPTNVSRSILGDVTAGIENPNTDFSGGNTGLLKSALDAPDGLPGRYGQPAGIAIGGLLGSVLGGPLGGLLGAMVGGRIGNRTGPAGGTGGAFGSLFGGSNSGDGNSGPGPSGGDSPGSRGPNAGNRGGGSRKNEQGSRR
nr:peptidoglycan DD-metalloendopeptidase family protein [Rhizobium album]